MYNKYSNSLKLRFHRKISRTNALKLFPSAFYANNLLIFYYFFFFFAGAPREKNFTNNFYEPRNFLNKVHSNYNLPGKPLPYNRIAQPTLFIDIAKKGSQNLKYAKATLKPEKPGKINRIKVGK